MHGDHGLGVRILCNALRPVCVALSSDLNMGAPSIGQSSTTTSAMSCTELRDFAVQYSKYYSAIINTSRGEEKVDEEEDSFSFPVVKMARHHSPYSHAAPTLPRPLPLLCHMF
jgi:hypothetical protein